LRHVFERTDGVVQCGAFTTILRKHEFVEPLKYFVVRATCRVARRRPVPVPWEPRAMRTP